jgi:hypothetical protein
MLGGGGEARHVEHGQQAGHGHRDRRARRLEGYFEKLPPILVEHRTPPEYYQLAADYGIAIQDDWVNELEQDYGVKL